MRFKIKLSSPDKIVMINQRLVDGRFVKVATKVRNLEFEILNASFIALARQTIHLVDYLQCLNYMKTLQSVTEIASDITLNKSDIENLIQGFELTKGNRPDNWTTCLDFFMQLAGPEQIMDPIETTVANTTP